MLLTSLETAENLLGDSTPVSLYEEDTDLVVPDDEKMESSDETGSNDSEECSDSEGDSTDCCDEVSLPDISTLQKSPGNF